MICLYPDCDWTPPDFTQEDNPASVSELITSPEARKRAIIDHINHDHDDAHVIIACRHELRELERFMARTISGETGQPVEFPQVRSECVRCGQFVVEDAPADDE